MRLVYAQMCGEAMTDGPAYCTAQTYRRTRDNPAEYCETEVEQEGDYCERHDEDDRRMDADYEYYLESLRKE